MRYGLNGLALMDNTVTATFREETYSVVQGLFPQASNIQQSRIAENYVQHYRYSMDYAPTTDVIQSDPVLRQIASTVLSAPANASDAQVATAVVNVVSGGGGGFAKLKPWLIYGAVAGLAYMFLFKRR